MAMVTRRRADMLGRNLRSGPSRVVMGSYANSPHSEHPDHTDRFVQLLEELGTTKEQFNKKLSTPGHLFSSFSMRLLVCFCVALRILPLWLSPQPRVFGLSATTL